MNFDKEKLIREFTQMKDIERSARDFYLLACEDETVAEDIKIKLSGIADDEDRHMKAVDKILNIIKNNL